MAPSTQFIRTAAWAAALMVASAGAAAAQAASANDQAGKPVPTAPDGAAANGSLSQRLNRSNGVITPPKNVDPGMSSPVPDPHPHTTPVIPPPAHQDKPGGDEPK
jgi:hypothetical protein